MKANDLVNKKVKCDIFGERTTMRRRTQDYCSLFIRETTP